MKDQKESVLTGLMFCLSIPRHMKVRGVSGQWMLILIAALMLTPEIALSSVAPKVISVPESWAMGNLAEVVKPDYPAEAKSQHAGGKVIVKITIDEHGAVKDLAPVSGNPLLTRAAIEAVKRWKFRPYVRDNQAAIVESTATIEFVPETGEVRVPKPMNGPFRLRVSQGVADGNLIHKVDPRYPEAARQQHISGDVILQALINRDGNISELRPLQGPPPLIDTAMEAVWQWKYKPYRLNGEPVEVETAIKISFKM